jgi:hypothetical protein
MKALYNLYPDAGAAQHAVDRLRATGVADRDIVLRSSEPLDGGEFRDRDTGTWLPWISTAGGAVGLCVGTWLPLATAQAWPIQTGGMSIVSWWPNLIIMFELTMLGAILATVAGLIVTAGLAVRTTTIDEPAVADGLILVGVMNPPAQVTTHLEEVLSAGGVGRVRKLD